MNIAAEDQRPRYTASKTIKKTPLSELNDDEMSSSDDDSDEEMLPIFANKITKKMKDSEFVRSLQAISDEATPFDLLDSCKEQGNEHYKKAVACLKEKDVLTDPKKKEKLVYHQKTAIRFYTDGVLVDLEKDTKAEHTIEEAKTIHKIKSQVLSNRSLVHYQRENFRKSLRDCKAAIRFDVTNLKAYYRATKALIALERYHEGIKYIERGCDESKILKRMYQDFDNNIIIKKIPKKDDVEKKSEPDLTKKIIKKNFKKSMKTLLKLKAEIFVKIKLQYEKNAKKAVELSMKKNKLYEIQAVAMHRGIRMGPPVFEYGAQQHDAKPLLDPNNTGLISWPLLILYEEYGQTDFIQLTNEMDTFFEQLSVVLPDNGPYAPWDRMRKYTISNIEVYFQVDQVPAFDCTLTNGKKWPLKPKPITRKDALKGKLETENVWVRIDDLVNTYIGEMLSSPQYVIPQIPVIYVVPRETAFYQMFRRRNKIVEFVRR
eukprot:g953.t1